MAEMIDLKSSKAKMEDIAVCAQGGNSYPWGLSINLNEETIEKLGINFKSINTGQKVKITGEALIESKSENEQDGKKDRDIRLQITSLKKPAPVNRMKAGAKILKDMRSK